MEDNISSVADIMAKIFNSGFLSKANESNKIVNTWHSTLSKIHGVGDQLSAHTEVIDLKDGVLSIQTDHPSWSQLLQLHSTFILKGLSFSMPEAEIKTMVFRVKNGN